MPDNFYVQPASPLAGFNALMEGIESRGEFERAKSQEVAKQGKLQELQRLYRDGSEGELTDFLIQNPGLGESLEKSTGVEKRMTDAEDIDAAWNFYTTGNPEVLTNRAEAVLKRGGSAEETLQLAQLAHTEPEQAKKIVAGMLARKDTDKFKAYRESQGLGGGEAAPKQKTGAFLVRDDVTGKTSVAVGSYDTGTGKLTTETAEFSGMDVVSRLGETAREQSARRVGEAGESQEAKDKARRYSDIVTRGTSAAEGAATYKRGIELLKKIKTGGMNAVSLAAKRIFGVEGADEGELSNSLAKAVLSQYRETFGAAFTENEGKKLDKIEAAFSKSPESNARLLSQALKLSERTANRAIKAAERREDYETADDIRDLLDFTLSTDAPEQEPAQPKVQGPVQVATQEQYNSLPSGAIYIEDGQQYRKP